VFAAILRAHPGHPLARSLTLARSPATQATTTATVGRNDPCPCGSGRKYKQCHGSLSAPPSSTALPPSAPPPEAPAAFVAQGSAAVLRGRAQAALERDDIVEAGRLYRRVLERRPDDPVATAYLGAIATREGRFDEAEALLERALALDPLAADSHNNLGMLRHAQARFAEAIAAYRRALELAPGHGAVHNNLGLSLQESGALDEAIASFREAVRAMPANASAHWNLSLALLLRGDYAEGLAEHEWRIESAQHQSWWASRRLFPEWRGEPLEGRRILVLAEQGMGDMIQFVRYGKLLADRGATVVVETAPELSELLATAPGVAEIARLGGPYPRCDLQVPMLSLPLRLGTRVESIPAPERYLVAEPSRIARWASRLGPRTKPRIGIAWAGNPNHVRDRFRSMPLSAFLPLLAMDEYEWLSVQKGAAAGDIARLPREVQVRDLGSDSATFADLAALLEALDLVITVDTAVVHVAGALGRPAVLLIDAANDWRWPRAGTDCRWYPSVRIARQVERGQWDGAVGDALAQLASMPISRR
jgi:tetratricopeptide (TPR) repeat protein